VIARHPHTTFICPHVGSKADCLDSAADDLDAFPNLYYDFSARIPILGLSKRRAAHSREFLIQYQDRVLLGTDIIYDDTNVPTGIQAQCLYQPGEIPLGDADPKDRYVETTAAFFASHLDFLTTDQVQVNPPFKRCRKGFSITGLALPPEVCQKILYRNASRLFRIEQDPAPAFSTNRV
jgi:predicted TIM-barrel fold metal-dependent hydrolase